MNKPPVLLERIAQTWHYWQVREQYSHSLALKQSASGIFVCRFLLKPDWYMLYVWTVSGHDLAIHQNEIGGGYATLENLGDLLMETGFLLKSLDRAMRVGTLQLDLEMNGFSVIYKGV